MIRHAFLFPALMLLATTAQAGGVLTDKDGMTLYAYGKDEPEISHCYYGCAKTWNPYIGQKDDKMPEGWSLVDREGGDRQRTYHGKPLYFFSGDQKRGDMKGNNIDGLWHVIKK